MSAKDDFIQAIQAAEEILIAIDQGHGPTSIDARDYRSGVEHCRKKWREGEAGHFTVPHDIYVKGEEACLAWVEEVRQGALLVTRLDVLPRLRAVGYFQHAPLRRPEKESLEQIMMYRSTIPWGLVDVFLMFSPADILGCHFHPQFKQNVRCRCQDYYRRKRGA